MRLKDRLAKLEAEQHAAAQGSLADRLRRAREEYERGDREPLSDGELRAIVERVRGRQ